MRPLTVNGEPVEFGSTKMPAANERPQPYRSEENHALPAFAKKISAIFVASITFAGEQNRTATESQTGRARRQQPRTRKSNAPAYLPYRRVVYDFDQFG